MSKIKDWINKKIQRVGEFEKKHPFIVSLIALSIVYFLLKLAFTFLLVSICNTESYSQLDGFNFGFEAGLGICFCFCTLSIALEGVFAIAETISPYIRKWLKIEKRKEKDTE